MWLKCFGTVFWKNSKSNKKKITIIRWIQFFNPYVAGQNFFIAHAKCSFGIASSLPVTYFFFFLILATSLKRQALILDSKIRGGTRSVQYRAQWSCVEYFSGKNGRVLVALWHGLLLRNRNQPFGNPEERTWFFSEIDLIHPFINFSIDGWSDGDESLMN